MGEKGKRQILGGCMACVKHLDCLTLYPEVLHPVDKALFYVG